MAKPFGEQVIKARTAKGLSQKELATKAKLSYDTIRGIENGYIKNSNPTLFVIQHLQQVLETKFEL